MTNQASKSVSRWSFTRDDDDPSLGAIRPHPQGEYVEFHHYDSREGELLAESEARHQSCLVLMKSVHDHRDEIKRLQWSLREVRKEVTAAHPDWGRALRIMDEAVPSSSETAG